MKREDWGKQWHQATLEKGEYPNTVIFWKYFYPAKTAILNLQIENIWHSKVLFPKHVTKLTMLDWGYYLDITERWVK